jgi:hypothetical protein
VEFEILKASKACRKEANFSSLREGKKIKSLVSCSINYVSLLSSSEAVKFLAPVKTACTYKATFNSFQATNEISLGNNRIFYY